MYASREEDTLACLMRIGLAGKPYESVIFTDEPKLPNYVCVPNDKARGLLRCNGIYGHGSGLTDAEAMIKSLGEFYERLCIENPDLSKITNAPYGDSAHADPRSFVCYSEEQYESKSEHLEKLLESRLDWYPVYDVLGRGEIRIPASLIFLYPDFGDQCEIRREQITTGAAFGPKGGVAFESGLLEAVERDAFITAYLTGRKPPMLRDFPPDIQKLLDYLNRYRLEAHVFDITTDLMVPTFMTVTVDTTGLGPAVDVGACAGYSHAKAVYGSIKESIQSRGTSRYMRSRTTKNTSGEVRTLQDRYYYWYGTEMIRHLNFWLKGAECTSFYKLPEYSRSVTDTQSIMEDAGFHIYAADISVGEVSDAGFEAIKVVVPELHPVYLDERAKSLYSVHAGTIPDDKSLKPHPFA